MDNNAFLKPNYDYFKVYPISYYAAMSGSAENLRLIEQPTEFKAEADALQPAFPAYHQALSQHELFLPRLFLAQLSPLMSEYVDHFKEISFQKDIIFRLIQRDLWQASQRRKDQLAAGELYDALLAMMFERILLNALARHELFIRIAAMRSEKHKWMLANLTDKHIAFLMTEKDLWRQWWEHVRHLAIGLPPLNFQPFSHLVPDYKKPGVDQKGLSASINVFRSQRKLTRQIFGHVFEEKVLALSESIARNDNAASGRIIDSIAILFTRTWNKHWNANPEFNALAKQQFVTFLSQWQSRPKVQDEYTHLASPLHESSKAKRTGPIDQQKEDLLLSSYPNLQNHQRHSEVAIETSEIEKMLLQQEKPGNARLNDIFAHTQKTALREDKRIVEALFRDALNQTLEPPKLDQRHFHEQINRGLAAHDYTWTSELARLNWFAMIRKG
jgi:hypothetical protein